MSPLLAAVLGCLLVLSPLLIYAARQPDDFNVRVGAVFLLGEEARQGQAPLAALDASLGRHLLMFNAQGDQNGRHHAPGRPMLDYVTGLAFLIGAAALLRRLADWRSLFLLAALALGLLPSALAVDAPHAMRSFEAAPLACAIAALGLGELMRMLRPDRAGRSRPLLAGAAAALALALGLNAWVYFAIMPPDREVFLGFYPVQSRMGVYVREHAGEPGRVFVPRGVADDEIFRFLSYGLPVETFDGPRPSTAPRPGDRFLLSGYEAAAERAALAAYLGPDPQPVASGPAFPDRSLTTFFVYAVP